jgi:hypothetical protein
MNFKSKIKRTGQTADADIHKQVLSSNYDMLVLVKKDKLDYKHLLQSHSGDPVLGLYINEGKVKKIVQMLFSCSQLCVSHHAKMD